MKKRPSRSLIGLFARNILSLAVWLIAVSSLGQSNCVAPPSGLTNWWPGQNNANDVIGGLNGTLSNGTSFASGFVGQAFSFNGVNQYVTNAVPALTNILNSYSMEFWAKPTAGRQATTESTTGTAGIANQRYAIFPNNGRFGAAGAGVSVGTNGVSVFEHASAYLPSLLVYDVAITNWVHVAVVYSNQQPTLYLNGSLVRTGLTSTHSSSPSTCLGENGLGYGYYAGLLDEVSIYDRALTVAEILSIYSASNSGKCGPPTPPQITVQPTNQTVTAGGTVTFNVGVIGTLPLSYQWLFNGTNIATSTSASLVLTNTQLSQAGNYQVVVTNIVGSATSLVVTLTVTCGPSGLVALYSAEGNANDSAGTNNGNSINLVYASGKIGQAFSFNGSTARRVFVPDNPNFKLTNSFTIESWLYIFGDGGVVFFRGDDRVDLDPLAISMGGSGFINFTLTSDSQNATITAPIGYNQWKHIAATMDGTSGDMKFYVDGVIAAQMTTAVRPIGDLDPASTPGVGIGNTSGTSYNFPFNGLIDEVGVYSRALSQTEIQFIINTGSHSQCLPPIIVAQPTNQTVVTGNTASFTVVAAGSPTLVYQWSFNGTNIAGATKSNFVLGLVQTNNTGNYAIQISNPIGTTNSATAVLTVLPTPLCITPGSNMVSWWRAEGNAVDEVSGNNGILSNGVSFAAVRTGQGFAFNGNGAVVALGNPRNLQLQDLTIETWIQRTSSAVVSSNGSGSGHIFAYDNGGYGLYLASGGTPTLSKIGVNSVLASASITDTNLHHLAVTKAGSTVVFYIDGIAYPASAYNPGFTFAGNSYVGGLGTNNSFLGAVDELAVYNRALASAEIQGIYNVSLSGKCTASNYAPFFITQPVSQIVLAGTNITLNSVAAGTPPLLYQWSFKSNNIPGATNASLTLSNVQPAQTGAYAVSVTNVGGNTKSTNATLTINFPVAVVRVVNTNVSAANPVTVPVTLAANGNENALAFSLNYDTTRLTYASAVLGGGAAGALFQPNTSQMNLGRIGISVIMPFGTTFVPGTQTVAQVTFNSILFTNGAPVASSISLGDQPTARQLLDTQPAFLPVGFSNGTVTIVATTNFEGDVFPRPTADRTNSLIDWLYLGRYVARLDYPTNAAEFQRADSAPRTTFGDATIRVTDWVQAGRYSFGFDPQTPAGGPTNEVVPPPPAASGTRILSSMAVTLLGGESATVSVNLAAQGNENALSFSVSFDPSLVSFTSATLGSGAGGATFYINTNQLASGKVGFVLGVGIGSMLSAGNRELVRLGFQASPFVSGNFPLSFVDLPVPREISDTFALGLPVSFTASQLQVLTPPTLRIAQAGENVLVGWPLWASNFTLQEATNDLVPPAIWINVTQTPGVVGSENVVILPATNVSRYYRLIKP